MIQQSVFPRVKTHIAPVGKSFRFGGGTATVQVDSLGNYEVLVNGSRFSSQENSARRDARYRPAVGAISSQMAVAFDNRDALFTALHKKAPKIQTLSEHRKKIEALKPQRYEREPFPLKRPMTEDIRRELAAEAEIRITDLYEDKGKERRAFVKEHEKEAVAARLRAYEEVQAFFSDLQSYKEARANAAYQKEYEHQKREIEDFIEGKEALTETNLRTIIGELELPYRIELTSRYKEDSGLLETDIELCADMNIPTTKTNILSTGKISVKPKLVKEIEQLRSEAIMSLLYYIAASLFNATLNIRTQRLSVWLAGKREALVWIQFDRDNFSRLSMRNLNPLLNYYDWPRADALRMVRGALQFGAMDAVSFRNAITQAMAENGIDSEEEPEPAWKPDSMTMFTVPVGDAQRIADALPGDTVLGSLVNGAVNSGMSMVNLPQKYKGILKELNG